MTAFHCDQIQKTYDIFCLALSKPVFSAVHRHRQPIYHTKQFHGFQINIYLIGLLQLVFEIFHLFVIQSRENCRHLCSLIEWSNAVLLDVFIKWCYFQIHVLIVYVLRRLFMIQNHEINRMRLLCKFHFSGVFCSQVKFSNRRKFQNFSQTVHNS